MSENSIYVKGGPIPPRRRRAQLNWLLTVLPAFPLVLLVLRLWWLSRQDLPTVLRLLGGILLVSAPDDAGRSLLAVTALRMPDWVVLIAAMLAAFTWQLRLLPLLGMLVVAI